MSEQTELESLNKDIMAIKIVLKEWVKSGEFQKWANDMGGGKSWVELYLSHMENNH